MTHSRHRGAGGARAAAGSVGPHQVANDSFETAGAANESFATLPRPAAPAALTFAPMGVSRIVPLLLVALSAGCDSPAPPPPPVPTVAPSPTYAPPPSSGLSLSVGPVEAGLGHRASVLTLTNLDTRPRKVTGYPDLKVLAGDGTPLDVKVEHGTSYFARDLGPQDLTVQPGAKVVAVLAWSATVTSGDTRTGAAISVVPVPGEHEQKQPLDTDLGTTDTVTLSSWATEIGD